MLYILEFTKHKEIHNLSGIALIVDDKICLVLPKKFKNDKKYSIPKGHIEDNHTSYQTAYLELLEETGIDIGFIKHDSSFKYTYRKTGVKKNLDIFVVRISREDYEELEKRKKDRSEIYDARLVTKSKALKLVEPNFRKLIEYLFRK